MACQGSVILKQYDNLTHSKPGKYIYSTKKVSRHQRYIFQKNEYINILGKDSRKHFLHTPRIQKRIHVLLTHQ